MASSPNDILEAVDFEEDDHLNKKPLAQVVSEYPLADWTELSYEQELDEFGNGYDGIEPLTWLQLQDMAITLQMEYQHKTICFLSETRPPGVLRKNILLLELKIPLTIPPPTAMSHMTVWAFDQWLEIASLSTGKCDILLPSPFLIGALERSKIYRSSQPCKHSLWLSAADPSQLGYTIMPNALTSTRESARSTQQSEPWLPGFVIKDMPDPVWLWAFPPRMGVSVFSWYYRWSRNSSLKRCLVVEETMADLPEHALKEQLTRRWLLTVTEAETHPRLHLNHVLCQILMAYPRSPLLRQWYPKGLPMFLYFSRGDEGGARRVPERMIALDEHCPSIQGHIKLVESIFGKGFLPETSGLLIAKRFPDLSMHGPSVRQLLAERDSLAASFSRTWNLVRPELP